jgi:hypothetical protein
MTIASEKEIHTHDPKTGLLFERLLVDRIKTDDLHRTKLHGLEFELPYFPDQDKRK